MIFSPPGKFSRKADAKKTSGQIKGAPAVPAGAPESIISTLGSWRCIQSFFRTKLQLHLFSACDKYFSFEASIVLCWSLLFPVCFLSEAVAVTTKILRLGTSLHLRSLHCSLLGFFCFRSVPFRKPLPQLLKIIAEGNNASPSKLYRFSAGTFCFRSVPPREPLPQLHQFIARNNASSSKLL